MTRVFLDSSVVFSAALSPTGASFELFMLALRADIDIVVSNLVLEEVRRRRIPTHSVIGSSLLPP